MCVIVGQFRYTEKPFLGLNLEVDFPWTYAKVVFCFNGKTRQCLNVPFIFAEPTLLNIIILSSVPVVPMACRPANRDLSLLCPCLSRSGSRTEEPNRGSRSGPHRKFSQWVWCRVTGRCWEGCTSSRPAWPDSTTPNLWPTSPASPPCCLLGRTAATRARWASAPAPVSHHNQPPRGSMKTGTARWGATSHRPCSHWPPCNLWTQPRTGAKEEQRPIKQVK